MIQLLKNRNNSMMKKQKIVNKIKSAIKKEKEIINNEREELKNEINQRDKITKQLIKKLNENISFISLL